MKVFIPSKDRPSQLDLLLRSIEKNLPNINFDINILYTTSGKDYYIGYKKLFQNKYSNINLIPNYEMCFETDFYYVLKDNLGKNIMLLTDDCVFYKKCEALEEDINGLITEDVWCFSFRLGLNTTTQWYRTGQQQDHLSGLGYKLVSPHRVSPEAYIKWNWKIKPPFENYGYMMSWDGHIYRSSDLLNIVKSFTFYNPRTFEDRATKNLHDRELINRKYMISPNKSCLFVNTINSVQEEAPPHGDKYKCSTEELNNKYLCGEIISLDSFENLELNSSHEEIPLIFEQKND